MSKTHDLKCHPEPFQALLDGTKTGEFRLNDRNYEVGDILHQREYIPGGTKVFARFTNLTQTIDSFHGESRYTGRSVDHLVTHIVKGPAFGIPDGYCMMSLQPIHPDNAGAGYIPIKAEVLGRTLRNLESVRSMLRSADHKDPNVRGASAWTINVIEELRPFAPGRESAIPSANL